MATITIFPSLINKASENPYYMSSVLFAFMSGPHKIAKDVNGVILKRYYEVGQSEMIYKWMELMSYVDRFEPIFIDIGGEQDDEGRCLRLCRAINGLHMAFTNSLQEIKSTMNENNAVIVDGEPVLIKDRDEAVALIAKPNIQFVLQNSILANGSVIDSNNNNTNYYDER